MALVKYLPIFKMAAHRKSISADVDRGPVTGACGFDEVGRDND